MIISLVINLDLFYWIRKAVSVCKEGEVELEKNIVGGLMDDEESELRLELDSYCL